MSAALACTRPVAAACTRPAAPAAAATRASPLRPDVTHQRHQQRRRPVLAAAAPSSSGSPAAAAAADVSAAVEVLREACRTKKVAPEEVLAAIQQVEAAHQQQPLVQGFPAALTGTWRLVFSSPSPIKQWQYIPVLEDAIIDVSAGTVDLVSVVGPLDNAFKGSCTFESDPASGRYAMNFGFSASESTWFGRWHTKAEMKSKQKVYSFFLLTDDVAVANSSGGPKTLMYRFK